MRNDCQCYKMGLRPFVETCKVIDCKEIDLDGTGETNLETEGKSGTKVARSKVSHLAACKGIFHRNHKTSNLPQTRHRIRKKETFIYSPGLNNPMKETILICPVPKTLLNKNDSTCIRSN